VVVIHPNPSVVAQGPVFVFPGAAFGDAFALGEAFGAGVVAFGDCGALEGEGINAGVVAFADGFADAFAVALGDGAGVGECEATGVGVDDGRTAEGDGVGVGVNDGFGEGLT